MSEKKQELVRASQTPGCSEDNPITGGWGDTLWINHHDYLDYAPPDRDHDTPFMLTPHAAKQLVDLLVLRFGVGILPK